jgi:predicted site-specific integrase-resolvase
MVKTNDKWLKRAEVAALARVSTHTIRAYEIRGVLRPVRINARTIRYKAADVQKLLNGEIAAGGREALKK